MKKFVFASVMALASVNLVSSPLLRAQSQDLSIKDPSEYNAYSMASTQADPAKKAQGLEDFLTKYPQSVAKNVVLNLLVDTYQQTNQPDKALDAATKLLQVEPSNMKALYLSVAIKNQQCKKVLDAKGFATDPAPCDDAAALAQKGLTAAKPAGTSDDDWKKMTGASYPVFDSAIAFDDVVSKKDFKAAVDEYRKELMLFPPEATTTPGLGLSDTLNLAETYVKLSPPDMVNAVWFYARAIDFAPAGYKPVIEKKLDYWYNKYHGSLDGLDAIKAQGQTTLFPPGTLTIAPADTPAEKIHKILASTPDLNTLALADKELVLSFGSKEDADKLWALLKDKPTPVPGTVIEATASQIKVAVTDDAKQSKTPDFVVNLKTPLTDKEIEAVKPGTELGLSSKNQAELDGTYDSYTQIPGTDTVSQSAQIVLREGALTPEKKAPVHKPAAAHHTAH
jgi:tetratricopeptide (TPR) repeat protein